MINLEKQVKILEKTIQEKGIDLEKRKCQVVFCIDNSGSMGNLYRKGIVQKITERIFPLAMKFDDDKLLEFYTFDHDYKKYKDITINSLENYIDDNKIKAFGGTEYANPIKHIVAEKKNDKIPTFVIFITDGDNNDKESTNKIIKQASKFPIFFKFIGIGNQDFYYLKELDVVTGRFVDNANFIEIHDIDTISDEKLYDLILEEYDEWYEKYYNKINKKKFLGIF